MSADSTTPVDARARPVDFDCKNAAVPPSGLIIPHTATYAQAELSLVQSRIDRYLGNKTKAAQSLQISLKTIYNILNRAGAKL